MLANLEMTPDACQPEICAGTQSRWFALRVLSNREKPVSNLLRAKGVEEFLPAYRSRRLWSDRIQNLDLPLFSGYVFCRIPIEERRSVLATTGVVGMVGIKKQPLPIPDQEIAAIRKMIESQSNVEPWPFVRIGQRVKVRRGPLAGLEGILLTAKNSHRLIVSVTLLGRSVAAGIDAAYVTPI
jgi:transcription antitermination factor NusG